MKIVIQKCTIALVIIFSTVITCQAQNYNLEEAVFTFPYQYDSNGILLDLEIDNKPARIFYDSGTSNLALFEQSFPHIEAKTEPNIRGNVFGGDQKASAKKAEPVQITLNIEQITIPNAILIDYSPYQIHETDAPHFDGLLPILRVQKDGKTSIVLFDPFAKIVAHLKAGANVNFEKSQSYPFNIEDGWIWQVTLPMTLPGQNEEKLYTFIVDTGSSNELILNRSRHPDIEILQCALPQSIGLGGRYQPDYLGQSQFRIGRETALIDTVGIDMLPFSQQSDGVIGWKFLRRFRTAFDLDAGQISIDLNEADFTDSPVRSIKRPGGGMPSANWDGLTVFILGTWENSGLNIGDKIVSIDGQTLSKTKMQSVIKDKNDNPYLCWVPHLKTQEICGFAIPEMRSSDKN